MQKVDEYKEEEKYRKIKKNQWENWKKTKEMLYDKYQIENKKWD